MHQHGVGLIVLKISTGRPTNGCLSRSWPDDKPGDRKKIKCDCYRGGLATALANNTLRISSMCAGRVRQQPPTMLAPVAHHSSLAILPNSSTPPPVESFRRRPVPSTQSRATASHSSPLLGYATRAIGDSRAFASPARPERATEPGGVLPQEEFGAGGLDTATNDFCPTCEPAPELVVSAASRRACTVIAEGCRHDDDDCATAESTRSAPETWSGAVQFTPTPITLSAEVRVCPPPSHPLEGFHMRSAKSWRLSPLCQY